MASSRKVRVGIVGISPDRGFASEAHIPALRSLPDIEIVAVCTTRQESAEIAARHFGAGLAFADPAELARHPDVDLVTVTVRAPSHYKPVMAALEAGKHVYCEWPLAGSTSEAVRMVEATRRAGVRHAVGLQGQVAPEINYLKDLIAGGYVGRPLSATSIGSRALVASVDRASQADFNGDANMLTITGGHQIDALCYCLGEFRELSAFVVSQRDRIFAKDVGAMVDKTAPDQFVVSGIVESGAVVSFQICAGMDLRTGYRLEVHGDEGDLVLSSTMIASMQRQPLRLRGAQGRDMLADLPIPDRYRWVPDETPKDTPYNVAQLYAGLTDAIRGGNRHYPDFDSALRRHRLIDAVARAADTGHRQTL